MSLFFALHLQSSAIRVLIRVQYSHIVARTSARTSRALFHTSAVQFYRVSTALAYCYWELLIHVTCNSQSWIIGSLRPPVY